MNGGVCEIGSIPLPNSTWLIGAVSTFQVNYGEVHPFLALLLCFAGTVMNIITVIVLTRPQMMSPVNVLLCSVALCDIIVMTSYFVLVLHFFITAAGRCDPDDYSYHWAQFTIFHAHVSVIFHATSIWLTVSLAQIRVLTIRKATAGPIRSITTKFTAILSLVTCMIMTGINLPNFLTFEIVEVPASAYLSCQQPLEDTIINSFNSSSTEILLNQMESNSSIDYYENIIDDQDDFLNDSMQSAFTVKAHEDNCVRLKMAFWSHGMIFKVVPCILLTVSIIALLKLIADVGTRKKSLCEVMKKKVPKDHTTPMLVAVLSIFLLAELPQGFMLVMTGVFSSQTFHKNIYVPLGDFMDLLSLINSAVNFLIYCAMSRKFRIVFFQLFFSCCKNSFDNYDEFNQFEKTDYSHRKISSAMNTNNTKTEQISHYPSNASTLNVSAFDHPQKRNNNLLSVNEYCIKQPVPDLKRRFSASVTANQNEPGVEAIKSQKRISFNLENELSSFGENPHRIPARFSIMSSPRVSTWTRMRRRIRPLTKLSKYFCKGDSSLFLNPSVTSPERRFNALRTETNGYGF